MVAVFTQEPKDTFPSVSIDHVDLDILVLFQILQHCKDAAPESATGQLLGIDMTKTGTDAQEGGEAVDLCVSYSYPFPHSHQHHHQHKLDEETATEASNYQLEMLRCLRDARVDHQVVGWYAVVSSSKAFPTGLMMNHSFMETQFGYQQALPTSILLLVDEEAARLHAPCVRAYRLSDTGMQLYHRQQNLRKPILASSCPELLNPDQLLTIVPIQITFNTMSKHIFTKLQEQPSSDTITLPCLTQLTPMLIARMEALISTLNAHSTEENRFQHYQKSFYRYQQMVNNALTARKTENEQRAKRGEPLLSEEAATQHLRAPFEPARLDDLILQHQLKSLSEQLLKLTDIGLHRLNVNL
jgi:translation initiation factor 3 subunit H